MKKIPVFYRPEMLWEFPESVSPSALKPKQVVEGWLADTGGMAPWIEVIPPKPIERAALQIAHSKRYIDGVFKGLVENGFGVKSPGYAWSTTYTVGSLMDAARMVVVEPNFRAACSPTSGFHHARWGDGGGFCTFNGLAVVALTAVRKWRLQKVAIIDCDYHYGDGTQEILDRKRPGRKVAHWSSGAWYRGPSNAARFMRDLRTNVRRAIDGAGLVLYQAGVDMHREDPLGGMLDNQQMFDRDCAVFDEVKAANIPLVWNLAGGYWRDLDDSIKPVLKLHNQTMQACIDIFT